MEVFAGIAILHIINIYNNAILHALKIYYNNIFLVHVVITKLSVGLLYTTTDEIVHLIQTKFSYIIHSTLKSLRVATY